MSKKNKIEWIKQALQPKRKLAPNLYKILENGKHHLLLTNKTVQEVETESIKVLEVIA